VLDAPRGERAGLEPLDGDGLPADVADAERAGVDLLERPFHLGERRRDRAGRERGADAFGKRVGDGTTEAVERISTTLTARSIASSLLEVDRALEKVEAGTFGVCDVCEDTIPVERLEARPFTSRCIRHAS
jgi:DnaK suppressor protein